MWIYDLDTLSFLEVNEAAVKQYGYSRAEFLRMRLSDIRPKEEIARLKTHVRAKRQRLQYSGEWQHLKKDGTLIYVDIISHKLMYKRRKAALIVARDITESRLIHKALKESQAELADVVETAMDAILMIDDTQRIVLFNPAAEKMFQRSAAEVVGKSLALLMPRRFRKRHKQYVLNFGKSGTTKRTAANLGQLTGLRADGSEFPIEISISTVNATGRRIHTAIVRDISERRQAEQAREDQEKYFRALIEQSNEAIAVVSPTGKVLYESPSAQRIAGVSVADLKGKDVFRFIHPRDYAAGFKLFTELTRKPGKPVTGQIRYKHPDGTWHWIEATGTNQLHNPAVRAIVVNYHDISEHRQAEERLRENEAQYELLFESASIGIGLVDRSGKFLTFNSAILKPGGYTREDILRVGNVGRLYADPVQRKQVLALFRKQGQVSNHEVRFKRKDGSIYDALLSLSKVVIRGKPCIQAIVEDITERKRIERTLRENEERFRSLYENTNIGIYRTTPDGQILMSNPALVKMLEYESLQELTQRNLEKDGNNAEYSRREFKKLIEREGAIQGREASWRTKHGNAIYVRESARVVRDEKGKTLYYEGTVEDITERKKVEEALRTSESELRALFSAIPDLIMVLDQDGRYLKITSTNPDLLFQPVDELLGRRMHDIFSRQKADQLVKYIQRALRDHKPVQFEYAQLVRGKIMWFSCITTPLAKGTVVWVARDITSRKEIEQQTQRRLVELQVLYESGLAFSRTMDMRSIGDQIIHVLKKHLYWRYAAVRLLREDSDELDLLAFGAGESAPAAGTQKALARISSRGKGIVGQVMERGKTIRVGDLSKEPRFIETFPGMRSGLYVPMKVGEIVIGVISVESNQSEAFSEDDERLLLTLATQAASAIHNARLFNQSQRRAIESGTLYEITSELATLNDVPLLLETMARDIARILSVPGGVVHLYDSQHSQMEVVASTDSHIPLGVQPFHIGEGMIGNIAEFRKSLIIDDYQTWAGATAQFKDQPIYSVLGVPMLYRGELIGILVAHGLHATSAAQENNRKFTERDARLLSLFAGAAAGAVYSARLLASERKRLQEAETLQKATAALTSSLDTNEILDSLLDGLAQVIPYNNSAVFIQEDRSIRLVAGRGDGPNKLLGQSFPLEASTQKYVHEARAPLILADAQTDPRFYAWDDGQVIRSWLGMPLMVHEKVIGYLTLATDRANSYDSSHAELAMAFANQAATAIENANLLREATRYAQRWATLHAVSQELARVGEDLEQVYASIHHAASKLLPTEVFTITLTDDQRTYVEAVYLFDRGERSPVMKIPYGQGFSSKVIDSGVSIKIDDDLESKIEGVPFGAPDMARSILAVPLRVSDKIIGAMSVQSYKPNMYSSEDQLLLELLATQAAIAVENTRLFEETRRNAEEFKALYQMTRDVSTQQNRDLLLQTIVERAIELLRSKHGGLYLYDAERQDLELTLFSDMKLQTGTRLKLGEGAAGYVARTRQPLIIDDYQTWPGRSAQYEQVPLRAVLQVPILYGGELIGVLSVNEYDASERRFTQDDANLLSLFAAHAASVVHSTTQFEQISRRVEELGIMAQISSALRTASTRADMLPIISDQLTSLLKADCTLFAAFDPIEKELVIEQASGSIAPLVGRHVKPGEGLFGYLTQSSERYSTEDIRTDDRLVNAQLVRDLRSVLIIPLIVQEERIGLIGIGREEKNGSRPPAFSEREASLLTAIGDMVANAIQRASLHEETARNNEQLIVVNQLGRSLTETLNAQTVYERLARSILDLLADTSTVYIFIYDEEKKNIRLVHAIHEERALDVSTAIDIPLAKPEEGTLSQIIYTGEPMIVNQLDEFYRNKNAKPSMLDISDLHTKSALYAPIVSSDRVIGVIQVQSHLPRRYTPSDARLIGLVANSAAVAIQNARLFDQLEERVEQFSALHSIDLAIGSTTDLRVSLQVILESISRLLKVDAAGILLYDPSRLSLEYAGSVGFRTDVSRSVVRLGEGLAGRVALMRQTINIDELSKVELPPSFRKMTEREGFVSYRCLPLIAKGEVKGVLEIYHRSALPPKPEWANLLNLLAGQAAIAMDNAMLFNNLEHANTELEVAYDATIEGWSRALELRDQDTSGHTLRLLDTTITLARKIGIPDSELPNLRRGILLHDIGKMGVPDHILLKPGPLTEEEWEIMRQHPTNAYNLLSRIAYLRLALDIPYCHHEKWDGSGYPRGLKGEQIPLAARIFSVVDAYDALSHDRSYRSAWPKEKVIDYIKEQSGRQFDPRAVETFLGII